jgi:hypothetical protein
MCPVRSVTYVSGRSQRFWNDPSPLQNRGLCYQSVASVSRPLLGDGCRVRVDREHERRARVAEAVSDRSNIDLSGDKVRSIGMTQVVQANMRQVSRSLARGGA